MQSTWITLMVAGIAAAASVAAAVVASVYAGRAHQADANAQHARELENRNAERKYQIYEPMINYFASMFKPGGASEADAAAGTAKFSEFSTWITVFGSDDAVVAFHNLMQAAYNSPPPAILLRLYGDFLITARKDMGSPSTLVQREHLLGMRINDLYVQWDVIDPSFDEVCERLDWQPPWRASEVAPYTTGSAV